jgi:TonB-linked SusC/RagA family outer membrane protein
MKKYLLLIFIFLSGFIKVMQAQTVPVKGIVTTSDGEPLIGVSISVKDPDENTTAGTVTDIDGLFSIEAASGFVLEFRYVGFQTRTLVVGNQTDLTVVMTEDSEVLEELVVIGYGTVRKSDLTGAVTSVKAEELRNVASAGIESALQGKIPGVFINKKSGKPGATADIKIRGVGSFNGSGPLWIIDGVQQDPKTEFNLNDAESVEILRDGSAAAIYGAAAANGVIIVTTKRGKNDAKMAFNAYVGFTNPTNLPQMLNTRQLKELRIEDFNGQGKMTEAEILAFPTAYTAKDIRAYGLDFDYTNDDYNWRDILFSQGVTQNYDLSFSKGTDDYNYYASFNYFDEEGMYVDTKFQRYSFRLNSDIKVNKWLTFGESLQTTYTRNNPEANSNFLNNYMRTLPFMMPYDENNLPGGYGYFPNRDENGDPLIFPTLENPDKFPEEYTDIKNMLAVYDGSNVLADELTTHRIESNFNITGNLYAKIQPVKTFSITTRLTGGFGAGNTHSEIGKFWYYNTKNRLYSQVVQNLSQTYSLGHQIVANYHETLGYDHDLTLMLGTEGRRSQGTTLNASASNMLGDLYYIYLAEQAFRQIGDSYSNNASLSYFGRINYAYKDRYLLMALMRRDGYDRFSPKHRWGNFPSFSGAWKIAEEPFIRENAAFNWLTSLKLRASWGILGNSGIPQFLYTSNYVTDSANYAWGPNSDGDQTSAQGVRQDHLPNQDIKWEEIATTNIGLDIGLWSNTLLFSFDWYIKNTTDALFESSLPGMAGLGKNAANNINYTLNVGEIRNTGCDFELTYRNKIGNDFNYSLSTNLGFVKNEVLATDQDNTVLISGAVTGGNVAYTQKGLPMSTFFGYQTEGVFQTQEQVDAYNRKALENGWTTYQETGTAPGDLIFKDISGANGVPDGRIDSYDITNIGDPWPDFTYGLTLSANYKWFDFSLMLQGVRGNELYNDFRVKTHTFTLDYNTSAYALNRWTEAGSTNRNFRLSATDPNHNEGRISSWFVEDGSYLRLKNIQLGVTLPKAWTNPVRIANCRFYVSAQNLLTFTKYEGFDPEFSTDSNKAYGIDTGYYPQGKTVLCGVQVDF